MWAKVRRMCGKVSEWGEEPRALLQLQWPLCHLPPPAAAEQLRWAVAWADLSDPPPVLLPWL